MTAKLRLPDGEERTSTTASHPIISLQEIELITGDED